MLKRRIFTPGPTPLMPESQLAMAGPIMHHRTPEFAELLMSTIRNLQQIFRTSHDLVILSASGTGAMEAAVCNLLGPEDRALAVVAGKFGERWTQICQSHGVPCVQLVKEYGEAAGVQEICRSLSENAPIRALLIQGCETSTATSHDLEAIGSRLREQFPDVFIIVDGITALASQPVETDLWNLDVVVGGSQKSFAMTPGLSFLSVSPRAVKRMQERQASSFYFHLAKEVEAQRKGQTAYTPAVTLVEALHAATQAILVQGLERIIQDAELMASCTREGLRALGFRLVSECPANAVTAAFPPAGVDAITLAQSLEDRYALKVAGGQGPLKGRIIRIAHLGYFDTLDVFTVLAAIELCLLELGHSFESGAGLQAALTRATERSQPA
jgi:aspartate aminotransferase-like enzyme